MSDLAVCCDVGGVCVSSVSTLGRAAAAISVSVSARREINGPLCGGGGHQLGEQGLRWERGEFAGELAFSVSVFFFPVLFSIAGRARHPPAPAEYK